jgi:hypothetical protein
VQEEKRAAAVLARYSLQLVACAGVLALGAGVALAAYFGLVAAVAAVCFLALATLVATRP